MKKILTKRKWLESKIDEEVGKAFLMKSSIKKAISLQGAKQLPLSGNITIDTLKKDNGSNEKLQAEVTKYKKEYTSLQGKYDKDVSFILAKIHMVTKPIQTVPVSCNRFILAKIHMVTKL